LVDKSSGRSYKGDWECGLRNGKGRMEYGDGCTYDGQWKDDLRHGQGVFVSPAEGTYEGQWLAGRKDGKGKMTFVYVRQSTRSPPFTHLPFVHIKHNTGTATRMMATGSKTPSMVLAP